MPKQEWKLLIIDNASREPIREILNLSPLSNARVVRENQLGLTYARLCAVREAESELLVFSDDDTVLDTNYLAFVQKKFMEMREMGAAGGLSLPEYEIKPPSWFSLCLAPLGCRDLGSNSQTASWKDLGPRSYPTCAPIGAGMAIRREVLEIWAKLVEKDPKRQELGRKGAALSSGEDNDINLVTLANGWGVAYFPELKLTHLIPVRRLDKEYLKRLAFASSRDWIRVLALHGVSPWAPIPRWTVPLRKLKAWFTYRAWTGPAEYIRWYGACGHFEGRAAIRK